MTDIYAVLMKAVETVDRWAKDSAAALTRAPRRPADARIEVPVFPPAARHLTYKHPVDGSGLIGATMGPMAPMSGVKDPIYFTVVEVVGNRVGLAYGLWKLP